MSEAKIRIRGLSKAFGPKKVLQNLDLDVPDGQSVVVIGGSGTGKSVLLKCILGLLQPDSGSIRVDGQEVVGAGRREMEEIRRRFGMLFQGGALFDSLPVWENVAFGLLATRRLDRSAAHAKAVETLGRVGLPAATARVVISFAVFVGLRGRQLHAAVLSVLAL